MSPFGLSSWTRFERSAYGEALAAVLLFVICAAFAVAGGVS